MSKYQKIFFPHNIYPESNFTPSTLQNHLGNQRHVVRAVVPNADDKLSQIKLAAQVLVEDGEHPLAELGRLGVQVAVELVDGDLQGCRVGFNGALFTCSRLNRIVGGGSHQRYLSLSCPGAGGRGREYGVKGSSPNYASRKATFRV